MKEMLLTITIFTTQCLYIPPKPYIKLSNNKQCYFEMAYDETGHFMPQNGYGIAFTYDCNGKKVILWKTDGWFSVNTHLSDDGQRLVRLEDFSNDTKDTVLFFYNAGKLIKSYVVGDLMSHPRKFRDPTFGHFFLKKIALYSGDYLKIVTRENMVYVFYIFDDSVLMSSKEYSYKEKYNDILNSIRSWFLNTVYR